PRGRHGSDGAPALLCRMPKGRKGPRGRACRGAGATAIPDPLIVLVAHHLGTGAKAAQHPDRETRCAGTTTAGPLLTDELRMSAAAPPGRFGPEPDSSGFEHVLSCHNIVLRYLIRANPSPIAALHRIDSEAVGFDQLKKPVLSAGNPFLRAFPVERQARPYGMEEIEYRRASSDGRFSFDVKQENRHEAASACLQDAKHLSHIVLDLIRKHVGEDGASNCQIEPVVRKGEAKGGSAHDPLRIVTSCANICPREAKVRQLRFKLLSAPFNQNARNIEPIITTFRA